MPSEVGPALDAANNGLAALPKEKIDSLLTETSKAVGGLGPALQRLVDSTTAIASDFKDNLTPVNDIVDNSRPDPDSQVNSGDAISRWAHNLNTIASQTAEQDQALRNGLQQAAPTADQLDAVFSDVRESLPQTLANLAVVTDMLKRYHKGIEQALVILPQGATVAQAAHDLRRRGSAALRPLDRPAAAVSDRVPPCVAVAVTGRHQHQAAPDGFYCKIPKDYQATCSRCAQLSVRRRSRQAGGDAGGMPQQRSRTSRWAPTRGTGIRTRSSPARRPRRACDQPVKPGYVIPAPSINNGLNPLPADQLPPRRTSADQRPADGPWPGHRSPAVASSPTHASTLRQQGLLARSTTRHSGEVVGPDGVKYSVTNSSDPGENGWKEMLAPAG